MSPTQKLISEFVGQAMDLDNFSRAGDWRKQRAMTFQLLDQFRKIRSRGSEGRVALIGLLAHPEIGVRIAAATYCLEQ